MKRSTSHALGFQQMDDELLPPFMAGVREQWYKGEWVSVKAKARRRNVLLPQWALGELQALRQRKGSVGPEDPIFAGTGGKPALRERDCTAASQTRRPEAGHAVAELARPSAHFPKILL